MPATVYGIVNCDTVKRARAWLGEQGVDFVFHDFKKDGVPPARLDVWIATLGWERLLNVRGTTWRKLAASLRDGVVDAATARALILEQPSVVKRPVIDWDATTVTVGFDPVLWAQRRQVRPP